MFTARKSFVLVAIVMLAGCTTDDEDRCASGYVWDDEREICVSEEVLDTGMDTESDTGGVDSATEQDSDSSGLGLVCMTDTDCADYTATMCLTDPANPAAGGTCTINDCVPADCTGTFACCDCTSSVMFPQEAPICVPDAVLELFEGTLQCPCE